MDKQLYEKLLNASQKIASFPWQDEDFYCAWLSQTYYFVSHSTRLLHLCAALTNDDEEKVRQRFLEHIQEENFHEKLALKDLKKRKKNLSHFSEFTATKNFYRSQYYLINKYGFSVFLGYILFLEGVAITAGPEVAKKTEPEFGISSFLKVHIEEDQDHIKEAFELIASLSPEDKKVAVENFEDSVNNYINILESSVRYASNQKKGLEKAAA